MTAGGAEVIFSVEQACCGAPALHCSDFETARELAKRNTAALEVGEPEYGVTVYPTCAVALLEEFPRLLRGTDWQERALSLSAKVRDFSDFALNLLGIEAVASPTRVTYHDPCHQVSGIGGGESPRRMLATAGL